jgi:hypothetical protein
VISTGNHSKGGMITHYMKFSIYLHCGGKLAASSAGRGVRPSFHFVGWHHRYL